jgi:SNF2 family DNA or RNA helicase
MTEVTATRLEDLKPSASVLGLTPSGTAKVVSVEWYGDQAIKVIFEDPNGAVNDRIIYRDEEHSLEITSAGQMWTFDADGSLLRLVTEANRIKLAHHFDPYLAIHTSLIQPLPHQITAVYGEMLPRQPLRFLLADDPGSGKTIMAGLLIKELIARGDIERCLVVAPGGLVEQWQDELGEKFNLEFDILSRDMIENSRSGNPFNDRNHLICRLDVLARNEELQEKLIRSQGWDLIICDEAHRMSASYFGGDVKYTKRYQLGQKLGQICRHFLLMSATPHNGKEEDFQLFMALLDGDRFEGRFRDGVHYADTEDMMRRLTKEELLKFDGAPLFPERRAYTVKYDLSDPEASLYAAVTEYVRTETWGELSPIASTEIEQRIDGRTLVSGAIIETEDPHGERQLEPNQSIGRLIGQVELNVGNIKNSHVYLRPFIEKFPDDVIGGSNKSEMAEREITIDWGGHAPVQTDLYGSKRFFRARSWIKQFFGINAADAGDRAFVEEITPFRYRVRLNKSVGIQQ